MIEKIAMWGGFAGIIIAIFAIIVIYLTRSNIIDLLDRDVVMYDKNYEMKKEAFEKAFNCLDSIALNGVEIKNNPQYIQQAKQAYNALLCTLYSAKLYQEFYHLALDPTVSNFSINDIENFKIACRNELISKHKNKGEEFKGTVVGYTEHSVQKPTPTIPPQNIRPATPVKQAPPRPVQKPIPPNSKPNNE